ncbi:MAG: diaminopimelate decarboxylase [Chloroflexi bacterium]|nr:diaminopimelate decarboxylase [Chloroflexota bacterium]
MNGNQGFYVQDGYLYCAGLSVKEIQRQVEHSPFYLYSASQMRQNYRSYENALDQIPAVISYAVKANSNLTILKILRDLGSWVTVVSGNELRLALAAGFESKQMILNGNGKTLHELEYAIDVGVMINIDSEFDVKHLHQISQSIRKSVNVLLRLNPDIDPAVHPYISTGLQGSKFGIQPQQVEPFLQNLDAAPLLNLVGIHSHLGSTIENVDVFCQVSAVMAEYFVMMRERGFPVKYINIGGGLGIDYQRTRPGFAQPEDVVKAIQRELLDDAILILEPGRSLVGNAGVLVCNVIGVKLGETKNFIVVDGSMTELIRPSLYQAEHQIAFIEPVVGPVCESADFLGKNRLLATPDERIGLVVYDTGAYGYVMSSNYNGRMRPPEYLVDDGQLIQIRRAERFEDYLSLFDM